jgi:hypothetical protein
MGSPLSYQDSITSAIRNGTKAVVTAISTVIQTIASSIVTVRVAFYKKYADKSKPLYPHLTLSAGLQVVKTIADVIIDIVNCRYCGRRRSGALAGLGG